MANPLKMKFLEKIKQGKFSAERFVLIALLSLIFLGLIFFVLRYSFSSSQPDTTRYFLKNSSVQNDPFSTDMPQLWDILDGPIISRDDPVIGSLDAPVVVVNFSDFECEFCQEQETLIKQVLQEYEGKISYIWKDYPEVVAFSNSWKSSVAARCAQEQGKFWEYHDLLYSQIALSDKDKDFYIALADRVGLRRNVFKACLDDPEIADLIHSNILEAQALGIRGIPFLYVNDQGLMGEVTYEDLRDLIEIELKKSF